MQGSWGSGHGNEVQKDEDREVMGHETVRTDSLDIDPRVWDHQELT